MLIISHRIDDNWNDLHIKGNFHYNKNNNNWNGLYAKFYFKKDYNNDKFAVLNNIIKDKFESHIIDYMFDYSFSIS